MNRGWLIAVSIVIGIVLACAILPLGIFAIAVAAGSGEGATTMPASRWSEEIVSGSGTDRIVVINVSGVIGASPDTSLFSTQLSQDQLLSQIRQATTDQRVKAVVLRVDSPGGGVVASNEIYNELRKLRDAGKRLVISMGSTAASGGYYIATAGERIYANPDTLTGSLGVIVTLTNLEEVYDKIGLEEFVYKSGEFKDIGSATRQPTAEENEIWRDLIDQAYQGFVDVIVEGRNLPREEVLQLADGRIYTGRQARDLKLIDEFGGEQEAVAGAQGLAGLQNALVVRYRSTGSFRDLLLGKAQPDPDPLGIKSITQPQGPRLEYRMAP